MTAAVKASRIDIEEVMPAKISVRKNTAPNTELSPGSRLIA